MIVYRNTYPWFRLDELQIALNIDGFDLVTENAFAFYYTDVKLKQKKFKDFSYATTTTLIDPETIFVNAAWMKRLLAFSDTPKALEFQTLLCNKALSVLRRTHDFKGDHLFFERLNRQICKQSAELLQRRFDSCMTCLNTRVSELQKKLMHFETIQANGSQKEECNRKLHTLIENISDLKKEQSSLDDINTNLKYHDTARLLENIDQLTYRVQRLKNRTDGSINLGKRTNETPLHFSIKRTNETPLHFSIKLFSTTTIEPFSINDMAKLFSTTPMKMSTNAIPNDMAKLFSTTTLSTNATSNDMAKLFSPVKMSTNDMFEPVKISTMAKSMKLSIDGIKPVEISLNSIFDLSYKTLPVFCKNDTSEELDRQICKQLIELLQMNLDSKMIFFKTRVRNLEKIIRSMYTEMNAGAQKYEHRLKLFSILPQALIANWNLLDVEWYQKGIDEMKENLKCQKAKSVLDRILYINREGIYKVREEKITSKGNFLTRYDLTI
jgi:hypothetical protein